MSHSISKEELRRPVHLTEVGQNFFIKLMRSQKLVLAVIVGLFSVGVGYVFWEKASLKNEMGLQEQYYAIEKTYLKKKEGFEKAEMNKTAPTADKGAKKEEAPIQASGDLLKDYGVEIEGWNKLIESAPASKAAAMAALELTQIYLKYQKNPEALQVLTKVKNQQNSDSLLGAMVFHAYANLLSNEGRCQDAMGVWEGLEKRKTLSFLVEQARMGRALCLESMGQVEKAEGIFKEIADGGTAVGKGAQPNKSKSQIQQSAEKYLRYLKLKKNMTTKAL